MAGSAPAQYAPRVLARTLIAALAVAGVSACGDRAPPPLWPEPPPPTLAEPIGEGDAEAVDAASNGEATPTPQQGPERGEETEPPPKTNPEDGAVRIDGPREAT